MKLSIIIIHYKNKNKLIKCLNSIKKNTINKEIIIIDNNSKDNIKETLKEYNNISYIENKVNLGFSKACNQGVKISKNNHLLFLNPDTIIPHDTLEKSVKFYKQQNNIGFLGVKMINENGDFLKESKRGIPGPLTSLYKISKINNLFPKSRIINKYYLGNLDKDKNHKIDIIAGAFMMCSKKIIQSIKGFDERFFLFGEDIDISIKALKQGYENYYLSDVTITHIKGQSMKHNWKYIFHFYNSMIIFVEKYYFLLIFLTAPIAYTIMTIHYIKYFVLKENK